MSNIVIQKKSTPTFVFNIASGGANSCTTNLDQDYIIQYQSNGTSSVIECFTAGRYQSVTSGTLVSQNTNWGGYLNAFWQQKRWATDVDTPYGAYGLPKVYVDGCELNASCMGGTAVRHNWAMPQIDMTTISSSPTSLDVNLNCGLGSLYLPYDAVMTLWEEVGGPGGTWVQLTTTTVPDGTNSATGGYNPSINITYGTGDVGVKHYKLTYETNDPNPSYGNFSGFADMYVLIGSSSYDLPTIETAEHSFVTFTGNLPASCSYDRKVCYPVMDMDDLQYQMTIDVSQTGCYGNFPNPILGDGITSGTQIYLCVSTDCNIPTEIATAPDFMNYVAKLNNWNSVTSTDIWVNDLINWADVNSYIGSHFTYGECFNLLLCKREPDGMEWIDTVLGCSDSCFAWIQDECYTTHIRFRSNNNEFCFYYTQDTNYYQSIRLPLYFRDVQFPSQSTGYQKSDGTWVKLSERVQEEWTLTTDWMEAHQHKALKFTLSHDDVIVLNNMSIQGRITAQNNYQIQWESKTRPYPLAKGTCKVNTTLNTCTVNSNC